MTDSFGVTNFTDRQIRLIRGGATWVFLGALLFLAFFSYPMAILPQAMEVGKGDGINNLSFAISFPSQALMACVALPVIILHRWSVRWQWGIVIGFFALGLLLNLPSDLEYLDDFLKLLACVAIPLATAILMQEDRLPSFDRFCQVAFALWCLQAALGFIAIYRQTSVVGTTGNENWMAAVILTLIPWVYFFVKKLISTRIKTRPAASICAVTLVALPSLFLLYKAGSRAGMLAAVVVPVGLFALWFPSKAWQKALMVFAIGILACAFAFAAYRIKPTKLNQVVEKDVRVPMWSGTVALLRDHPLGVGSGQFQKRFTPYRIGSYHRRVVAADMTVHPHFELLNIGAQLGFFGLVAFILMVAPLFVVDRSNPLVLCSAISGVFLLFQSCLDMTMATPPTSLLAYFFIGICWTGLLRSRRGGPRERSMFIGKLAMSSVALLIGLTLTALDLFSDYYLRQGQLERHRAEKAFAGGRQAIAAEHQRAAYDHYVKAIVPSNRAIPNFEAGTLAVGAFKDADLGAMHFERVRKLDPDFSHINSQFAQISLLKGDYPAAARYLARECRLYPRSTQAWQAMLNFTLGTWQYDIALYAEEQLQNQYQEKIRNQLQGEALGIKQDEFIAAVAKDRKKDALSLAAHLSKKINRTYSDPLIRELEHGQQWPARLMDGDHNEFDFLYWRMCLRQHTELKPFMRPEGVDLAGFTSWFSREFEQSTGTEFRIPLQVLQVKHGNLLSLYACYSTYCRVAGGQCIIQCGTGGKPIYAIVLMGKTHYAVGSAENPYARTPDFSGIQAYRVTIPSGECKAVPLRGSVRWTPSTTRVFFPAEQYYTRNGILGHLVPPDNDFIPTGIPSIELIEMFASTAGPPPPLQILQKFCMREAFEPYRKIYTEIQRK